MSLASARTSFSGASPAVATVSAAVGVVEKLTRCATALAGRTN